MLDLLIAEYAIRLSLFSLYWEDGRLEKKIAREIKRHKTRSNAKKLIKLSDRMRKVTAAINALENAYDELTNTDEV